MKYFKTIPSPIGQLTIVADETHLTALYVGAEAENNITMMKKTNNHPVLLSAEIQLIEYFSGLRKKFDLPLSPKGTEFQNKAWLALSKIPYGKVWSYGEQAQYLKAPNAQRAVGGANGKNPLPVIIPCHRVIGASGKLTGFSGGMDMKIYLLRLEGHQVDADGLKLNRAT